MSDFDILRLRWVTPEYAVEHIQNAWIAQYAGHGFVSSLIAGGTQSVHSHSAMFRRNVNGKTTIDVLEIREFRGGQCRPLEYHLRQRGRIDVFSTCRHGIYKDQFDAIGAVRAMRLLTQYDYGWKGIFNMLGRRIPGVWALFPSHTSDVVPIDDESIRQPFCSHAVATATQVGGGVDVVPRMPNWLVTPGMLTTSMFYDYEFSIITPWCVKRHGPEIREFAKLYEADAA